MSDSGDVIEQARRWLRYAEDDLHAAESLQDQHLHWIVCFHAQQAAEKALKALLVLRGVPFPKTHDLVLLLALLPADLKTIDVAGVAELNDWSVQSRYPTEAVELSREDGQLALAIATQVIAMVRYDFDNFEKSRRPMAEITAAKVNELRARTGQGMMDCKKVLVEAEGDVDRAIDIFRKRGVKSSLQERAASEGRVVGVTAEDGSAGTLVEVNCNTDFTARSEPITKLAANAARLLLHNPTVDIQQAAEVSAEATQVAQTTGENVRIGKTAYLKAPAGGKVGLYLYGITGKIGVLMAFTGKPSEDLIKQIGGHIAFARPIGLNRSEVPPELVAKEKEIAVEQAKATGKPQQIAEKIAEGKLNSFFAERVLLDQEFFNAQVFKGSVQNYLKQNGVTLEKYVRIEVGQA